MTNFSIDALLKKAIELKASDIHLLEGEVPAFRLHGNIVKLKLSAVTKEDMISIVKNMAPLSVIEDINKLNDADFNYEIKGLSRFRVNVASSFGRISMVIRIISSEIPTLKQLNLPDMIEDFAHFENGIVFVTGVTGSGKSTTIASILEHINQTKQKHIITIEDPIEYVYTSKKSIITQRQAGVDTKDFLSGIKYALRQDPDVILIGEIRDMETLQSALNAAETGHLVFSTLHTANAIQTFNRVLSFFPPLERDAVRHQLAEVFRGTISQRLIEKEDKTGRVCALEVIKTTPTIKDYFLHDKLEDIYKFVDTSDDMITFNMSLYKLFKSGLISFESALENSDDPNEFQRKIRGAYTGADNRQIVL